MTGDTLPKEEPARFEADPYERNWIRFSLVLLVVFAASVAIAGFALGFALPGEHPRVDPRTVTDSGPFAEPGVRDLGAGEYEVVMVARQYSFDPREISVPEGATVTFRITSVDVQHGFKLQDTNVNMQIVPGHVSELTVTFDEPGQYPYICHEFCGIGHAAMFGTLTVTAAGGQ
jgi:cytochrome c oxidase subunit 2